MESSQYSPIMRDNKYFNLQQLININYLYSKMGYYTEKEGDNDTVHQKKVFLIMGTTTSGKTVAQYYLCQDTLIYGIQESKKLPYIIPQNVYQNAIVQKTPNTITTRIPNIRQIPHEQVLIIEIPDIKQLKPEEKSVEYLFLQKIFKEMMKLHIIVVIEETSLSDLGEIMASFQSVTQLFDIQEQNVRELISQSMSIVVNKVSEDSDDSDVKGSLEQVNDEAIAQESQELSQIITNVLKQDRVYLIKNIQPQANEQKELLQNLLQNSKFMSFSDQMILENYLDEINIESEQVVEVMINKLRVRELWESGVNMFDKFLRFLIDPKIWTQEKEENIELIQQVRSMVKADQHQLQQQYQAYHNNGSQQQVDFRGKKPSNTILGLVQKLIKGINRYQQQEQQDELSTLHHHTVSLIELLRELGLAIRKQLMLSITPIAKIQNIDMLITYSNSMLSLKQLLNRITHLQTILDYIIGILKYKSEEYQQSQESKQQQQLHHPCVVQLTKEVIGKIKQTFTDFDMSLLKTKNKNKTKSSKKIKTIILKKPNPTIQQLKRQFLTQINQRRNINIINQIINLPLSHFKLYLLIQQFKQLINEINKNQQKFLQLTIVTKQIALILHNYQFYVQEIKFLLVIPDWNRIAIAIKGIQRYQNTNNRNNIVDGKDIHFLNNVGIYAQQSMLKKVADKIFSLVDLIDKRKQNSNISNDNNYNYINEREDRTNLPDNWQMDYLQLEYQQEPNSSSPFWKIIKKAKHYQQLHSERITRFNQQMLLMKQHFI